jgi:branched-chain amino acid transport system ATP-binding protein
MFSVEGLTAGYGDVTIVRDFSMTVNRGSCVTILGPNGAGKTTTMLALVGELPVMAGRIVLDGVDLTDWRTPARVREGLVLVPQDRQLFPRMSVAENLQVPADSIRGVGDRPRTWSRADVEELFPILGERRTQPAGSLSGGQQQILAIARALLCQPACLLLDEPLGLAPIIVSQLMQALDTLKESGLAIVLVEQQVESALRLADDAIFLQRGSTVLTGKAADLRGDPEVIRSYLGVPS